MNFIRRRRERRVFKRVVREALEAMRRIDEGG